MARKKKGKMTGKADGLVHYSNRFGDISQRPGGADAETYATLPSMEVNRRNGSEFGFGSHYSKIWRESLAEYTYLFRNDLHSDLSKVFKNTMIDDKLHVAGKRSLDVRLNGDRFNNYSMGKGDFNSLVLLPMEINIAEDRNQVELLIPAFNPTEHLNFPKDTNNFRLFMTASVINKYEYNEALNSYVPFVEDEFVFSKTISTDRTYTNDPFSEQTLKIDFDFIPDPEHIVIVCIGVEFSIYLTTREVTNGEWCGMKVLKVA